ncbi:MAG: tetraacyldisaccharide 4'-kinase [Rhizomicrobium sp.]|jgi:tetraacyldisaccharide 4'-kinase
MRAPEFWSRNDLFARALSAALTPAGRMYGATVAWKRDHATTYRARAKVICIGNLTAGGSGKTPVAIAVARSLLARNKRAAFLTRGYGGRIAGPLLVDPITHTSADVGDEPLLLAEVAPTIVARDRKAGAILADAMGVDVIVMDDGHQNFSLRKNLSIIVVDGETGFGNGRVLPAGPLREPAAQGLARADAVVVLGGGSPELTGFVGPLLRGMISPARALTGSRRVVAFAGIGRPEKFFATLFSLGAEIIAAHAYGDHHGYTHDEIAQLKREAVAQNAVLLTTEKDFVRLPAKERPGIEAMPVQAIFDAPDDLERLLDRIIPLAQVEP